MSKAESDYGGPQCRVMRSIAVEVRLSDVMVMVVVVMTVVVQVVGVSMVEVMVVVVQVVVQVVVMMPVLIVVVMVKEKQESLFFTPKNNCATPNQNLKACGRPLWHLIISSSVNFQK